jgi:hypothetical protein
LAEIDIDQPKEVVVDRSGNKATFTKFTSSDTIRRIIGINNIVFMGAFEEGSISSSNYKSSHLVTTRGPDLRPLKGLLVDGVHTPPAVNISIDGSSAIIKGERSFVVPEKAERSVIFDQQEVSILTAEWVPSTEDSVGYSVERSKILKATPKLRVKNHGRIEFINSENQMWR